MIRAIEFAVANAADNKLGIDIINLSLGHPIFEPAATDPLVRAVESRRGQGRHRRRVGRQLRHQS